MPSLPHTPYVCMVWCLVKHQRQLTFVCVLVHILKFSVSSIFFADTITETLLNNKNNFYNWIMKERASWTGHLERDVFHNMFEGGQELAMIHE
jgi:hypothetical protein